MTLQDLLVYLVIGQTASILTAAWFAILINFILEIIIETQEERKDTFYG
jgi:hypothetical protein